MKWFKSTKKTAEPIWKIATKIVPDSDPMLLRTRKKKSSLLEYIHFSVQFFSRYFRTVGWIVL